MKVKYSWILVFMVFMGVSALGQNPKKHIRAGNKAYKEGKFADAEVDYRKAVAADSNYVKGKFNLGDAMYEQKNMKESAEIYGGVAENTTDSDIKSKSLYNYGNTMLAQKKYKEAMEAFKKSLLLNPNDQDAKYNFEYARKKMIQQQKQQKQQNKDKKDQNKDKKNQKDKNNQKKDQKKDQKNNQQKDQKDQQKKDQQGNKGDQQKKQKQSQRPVQMSKKDAQRMLKALKNDEKKTLYKLQKSKAKASKAKKSDIDW